MLPAAGVYAVKRRKKPVPKSPKPPPPEGTKSNPSKRHRDRLNQELNKLTNLLPFPEDVRARLDKLSILRLAVGYLKIKGYFAAILKNYSPSQPDDQSASSEGNVKIPAHLNKETFSEGDLLLQALHGFLIAVTADGYVFYVSPTVLEYLGFHQSDIIYQNVFELIHTEDRAMFRYQLHWSLSPPSFREAEQESSSLPRNESPLTSGTTIYDPQHLPPENSPFLERNFVCRFRCLLDNSSGFMALNFHGRLKFLHGQNKRADDGSLLPPQLALFAVATPLQPLSILELRSKIYLFQTKHKLDFTPVACDARGKVILGYTDAELCMRGSGYQFIHAADMMYCAEKHVRMMKMGESGMTIFRLLTKKEGWLWVQANAKLVYKGGRPDCIIARQRVLSNEEGEEHLQKRTTSQLPFHFTTGEAVLYENNLPGLLTSAPPRKGFKAKKEAFLDHDQIDPNSLLGAMMQQGASVYSSQPAPGSSFSFANVTRDPREWGPSDKNGKSIKDEADSLLSIIETLFERNETENDICKTVQNLNMEDLELQKLEESIFPVNELGPPSFQARVQQGVSPFIDEVTLSPENGKYMDFPPMNNTAASCSLRQQPPVMAATHQDAPLTPLQYLLMKPPKEKDRDHPQEHHWHSSGPDTIVRLPPEFQEVLPDLAQQKGRPSQEAPTFGMCQNSMPTPKMQEAFGQLNPMPTFSYQTSQHSLEPSSGTVFPSKCTFALSLEKADPEKEIEHSSGYDASAQSVQCRAHVHTYQWHDPKTVEISAPSSYQSPPQDTSPGCNVASPTPGEPVDMEAQFQTQKAQSSSLGAQETSSWILSRRAHYPQEGIQGMGTTTFSNLQQAKRTLPPCLGQQHTPLEGYQLPGAYSSCWQTLQEGPSPIIEGYSEQREFLTQHQHELVRGTGNSSVPFRTTLGYPGGLLMGEAGSRVSPHTAPDHLAKCQRDSMMCPRAQRASASTTWQSECRLSSPDYQSSIPTMDRGISPQASHRSPFLRSSHLSGALGEAPPSCRNRLSSSAPGQKGSLPPHPSDIPFSHVLLLERQPRSLPSLSYDIHFKPGHRNEESSSMEFPAAANSPKTQFLPSSEMKSLHPSWD